MLKRLRHIFLAKSSDKLRRLQKFDPFFYSNYYDDLAILDSSEKLRKHYLKYGIKECRFSCAEEAIGFFESRFGQLPADFSAEGYWAVNRDLKQIFTHDWQFKQHYLQFGRAEKRRYVSKDRLHLYDTPNKFEYHYTYGLTKPDGVVPSRRLTNELDFALETPFAPSAAVYLSKKPIAVVVHCFYPEVLPLMLEKVANIPATTDLYLSTDSEQKKTEIEALCAAWQKGSVEIRVFPNRGRDVAPKFIGFRDIYAKYDLFVHLHTKKSPHGGSPLETWRDYLLENLLGSPEIVASILSLFDDPKLGIVFPQHLFELRGVLNWGYDYDLARRLLKRMGVALNKNLALEFPSGSMFWGRSQAILPLLEAGLDFDDFPQEGAQIDGTLAHAIERSLLFIAESQGFEWLKVSRRGLYPLASTVLPVETKADIAKHRLSVFRPCLTSADAGLRPTALGIVETRPILSYPSRNPKPRLNLLAPTVNPRQSFGGLASAQKLFADIAAALGEGCDRRIIVTDAAIEEEGYEAFADYACAPLTPTLDQDPWLLIDASEREHGRLDLREGDLFIATAWWTARFATDLDQDRKRYFGVDRPFVYLIQDDEPYFYGWGAKFSRAEETYHHADKTIAVINSEELFSTMGAKYNFLYSFCIPYRINDKISALLKPVPRQRQILVYGRPSVSRNAFELICDALFQWQQSDPVRASRWKIVFLGETFDESLLHPVENAVIDGKVSLEKYAEYLNSSSVGISLMVSPHPSYPPLEMAEAGIKTITNDYPGKKMQRRLPDIVALEHLEPAALANAIEQAVDEREAFIGRIIARRPVQSLPLEMGKALDVARLASILRGVPEVQNLGQPQGLAQTVGRQLRTLGASTNSLMQKQLARLVK
ncbi:rhamnosyltransferase WsaF family glycosyltransferase [Rhodoblastus sp.]|uniref:rhamnosyltransferase WsaF family glycosyltransferase n=1 Tax=Rhodoblastus sp. TaxID=1962975 RepID=UPI003F9BCD1B